MEIHITDLGKEILLNKLNEDINANYKLNEITKIVILNAFIQIVINDKYNYYLSYKLC